MKHYPDYYGRSVVLIGKSSQGQPLEPVLVDSIVTAVEVFGNGELVNAAREVLGAGAEYLYLVRVISDNKRDLYYELKELYELFENMVDIDIIVPLGIKLADYIIDYPDLFRVSQEFIYNGNPVLKTGRIIQDVNLVRVNGLKTQAFSLGCVAVEEGTENLCPNPSFETGITGWTSQFDDGVFERDTSESYHGIASVKCKGGTGIRNRAYFTVNLQAGEQIRLSAYAKTIAENAVNLRIEYDGGDYSWKGFSGAFHTGSGEWERLFVAGEIATSDCIAYCFINNSSAENFAYFDAVQAEKKPYPTSFVDGTRANGRLGYEQFPRSHDSGAFDAIILDTGRFNLKEGDTIIVDYNTVNNIDAEIELLAFRNNKIEDSIILSSTIDVNKKVNEVTEKPVKDYFSLEGENVKYIVRTKIPFLKVYTNKSGKEKAYAEFDYNEYIANNTVYKYFARELAEACSRINAIGLLKPDNKDYHKLIEDSMRIREELDSITDYGKYILSIPSDCRYESGTGEYSSPYLTAFAGLLGTLPTGISPTNRGTKGVTGIDDNFTNLEIKNLSHYGHIVLYNSVRRGIAPYKAVTMARDDSPYRSVKNIRVANEVAKRVKSITDSFIGRWTANVETKLKDLLTALFESLVIEGKIREYSFEITEVRTDYIKIELELKLYNEINNIRTGVISTV